MKVSAKAEYACLALLELAMNHSSAEPVRVKKIADAHGIPHGFLIQALLQLKAAGYVTSTRGSSGGYQLARAPERVSVAEVLSAIDGTRRLDYDLPSAELAPLLRNLRSVWQRVDEVAERVLEQATLADLVERTRAEMSKPVVGDWI